MTNENKQLVEIIQANGIILTEAESIVTCFGVHLANATRLVEDAKSITVADENDQEGMDSARTVRLALAKVRVASETARKDFKSEYLKKGRAIDDIAKMVSKLIEPVEEQLDDMEKTALRLAKERKEKALTERYDERMRLLKPYCGINTVVHDFKNMTEDAFQSILAMQKTVYEANEAKRIKEEAERVELERLQKEEQARILIENEKLKKEKEERDEKDRIEREAREKKEAEEKAKRDLEIAEQRRIDDERIATERNARLIVEAELREKQEAEKIEKERIEKERLEKEAQERSAQLAPDKVKMVAFADRIRSVEMPTGLSDELQRLVLIYSNQLCLLADEIKKEVEKL